MTLSEALAASEEATGPVNDVLNIDAESREIDLPASESLFGVEGEKDVERKYFRCPKIIGDNIDLSTHQIYVHYTTATTKTGGFDTNKMVGAYRCDDVKDDESGNYITFSWLLSDNVLSQPGFVGFAVFAKYNEGEELKTKWKTQPAIGTVAMTVPDGEVIAEKYPDVINQIFTKLAEMEKGNVSDEAVAAAVSDYMAANPVNVVVDSELNEESANPIQNKVVAKKFSELSKEIANQGGGMSTEAANLLITILRNGVYSTDESANITALAEALEATKEEQPDTPVDPDAVTYTVTNNLTNVTTSNAAASVTEGASYSAILTAADGYELDTVTVTIGGVDVTSTVYADGKITIAAVTGNVVITAEAVAAESETVEVEMTTNNMVKHAELTVYSDEGTTTIDISNFNSPVPGHFSVDAFTEDTAVTITRSAMSSGTWKTLCIGECDANNDKVLYNAMLVDDGFGTDAEAKQFNYTVHAGRKLVIIRRTGSLSWFTITVTK